MKKTNIFAAATAMVMALASLPVVSASAGETFQPGDVDMDGVITGHDSAVVSRALYEEDASLTAEQFALADINGDNIVNQTDLEWIHGQEEYVIGDLCLKGEPRAHQLDAYTILQYVGWEKAGIHFQQDASAEAFADVTQLHKLCYASEKDGTVSINPVQYHLMDVDGDGDVDMDDAFNTVMAFSWYCSGFSKLIEERYDLLPQPYYEAWKMEHCGTHAFEGLTN